MNEKPRLYSKILKIKSKLQEINKAVQDLETECPYGRLEQLEELETSIGVLKCLVKLEQRKSNQDIMALSFVEKLIEWKFNSSNKGFIFLSTDFLRAATSFYSNLPAAREEPRWKLLLLVAGRWQLFLNTCY